MRFWEISPWNLTENEMIYRFRIMTMFRVHVFVDIRYFVILWNVTGNMVANMRTRSFWKYQTARMKSGTNAMTISIWQWTRRLLLTPLRNRPLYRQLIPLSIPRNIPLSNQPMNHRLIRQSARPRYVMTSEILNILENAPKSCKNVEVLVDSWTFSENLVTFQVL